MYKPLSPLATGCVEQAWDLFQSNDVDRLAGLHPALLSPGNPFPEVKRLVSLGEPLVAIVESVNVTTFAKGHKNPSEDLFPPRILSPRHVVQRTTVSRTLKAMYMYLSNVQVHRAKR